LIEGIVADEFGSDVIDDIGDGFADTLAEIATLHTVT
jgi:hypothetical protein